MTPPGPIILVGGPLGPKGGNGEPVEDANDPGGPEDPGRLGDCPRRP